MKLGADRLINLGFSGAVALVCALIANDFVRYYLTPAPAPPPRPTTSRRRRPRAPARLQADHLARLTGLPLPLPEEMPEVKEPVLDLSAEPVPTTLRLRLLGTLVAFPDRYSLASIVEVDTHDTSSFVIGDTVLGAELIGIERDRVYLLNNGQREYLDMGKAPPKVARRPPPKKRGKVAGRPIRKKSKGPPIGAGIRATSENSYEVPRSEIDRALGNLNQLAMKARIIPAFKDGKSVGFKLFSIRPDSLYSKIGIRNGDVIRRINGFELNSPEKALEVYMKLKEASRVDLELERGGKIVRKTYNIR